MRYMVIYSTFKPKTVCPSISLVDELVDTPLVPEEESVYRTRMSVDQSLKWSRWSGGGDIWCLWIYISYKMMS